MRIQHPQTTFFSAIAMLLKFFFVINILQVSAQSESVPFEEHFHLSTENKESFETEAGVLVNKFIDFWIV